MVENFLLQPIYCVGLHSFLLNKKILVCTLIKKIETKLNYIKIILIKVKQEIFYLLGIFRLENACMATPNLQDGSLAPSGTQPLERPPDPRISCNVCGSCFLIE